MDRTGELALWVGSLMPRLTKGLENGCQCFVEHIFCRLHKSRDTFFQTLSIDYIPVDSLENLARRTLVFRDIHVFPPRILLPFFAHVVRPWCDKMLVLLSEFSRCLRPFP